MCRECLQCMDHTGFAPAHRGMCFPGLHCLGSRVLCRALSKAGPAFCALPRSKLLRFSETPQGHRLGPFCALSRSKQLRKPGAWRGHCPRWAVHLTTSPVPATQFPRYAMGVPSQLCISSGELTSGCNLLAGVNHPGSQVDVVSSWGPAHSLVEDAVSGAETGAAPPPPPPSGSDSRMPASALAGVGGGLYAAGSLSFDILVVLCSVSGPGYVKEPSLGKFSLYFSSLAIPEFGLLSRISFLRLSSGHSGLVLTPRTDDATQASLSSLHSLVVDVSIWAASPLAVAVRHLFCAFPPAPALGYVAL